MLWSCEIQLGSLIVLVLSALALPERDAARIQCRAISRSAVASGTGKKLIAPHGGCGFLEQLGTDHPGQGLVYDHGLYGPLEPWFNKTTW